MFNIHGFAEMEEQNLINYIREEQKKAMSNNWIPLGDRVLIERGEDITTYKGTIFIPENDKEKQSEGTVLAIGDGKRDNDGKRIPIDVEVGDRVVFGKYAGIEARIKDEVYLVVKAEEILMKLPKEKAMSA